MTLIDLIIIYLACGCPVGVHIITRQKRESWAIVAAAFLFWPIILVMLVAGRFGGDKSEISLSKIEEIRNEIEASAFADGSTVSLFEFRDVFYRYVGLTEAVTFAGKKNASSPFEIFRIAGGGDDVLPTVCLDRKERLRLAFHQTRTREEFMTLMADLKSLDPAMRLAEHLGDDGAIRLLNYANETEVPTRSQPSDRLVSVKHSFAAEI